MNTENNTNPTTSMVVVESNVTDFITVEPCIFILFAEYLGFVSPFINWAEDCCTKSEIPEYQINILRAECKSFLRKMKTDYTDTELHEWYKTFRDLAISEWQTRYNRLHPRQMAIAF